MKDQLVKKDLSMKSTAIFIVLGLISIEFLQGGSIREIALRVIMDIAIFVFLAIFLNVVFPKNK